MFSDLLQAILAEDKGEKQKCGKGNVVSSTETGFPSMLSSDYGLCNTTNNLLTYPIAMFQVVTILLFCLQDGNKYFMRKKQQNTYNLIAFINKFSQ